jgi:hypothetical protein
MALGEKVTLSARRRAMVLLARTRATKQLLGGREGRRRKGEEGAGGVGILTM